MTVRSAQSLEFVRAKVEAKDAAGVVADPTADDVSLALLDRFTYPSGTTTWLPAAWQTDTSDPANPVYYAAVLVGPGGDYQPVAGEYINIWVKVTDNPETPVKSAGSILFE